MAEIHVIALRPYSARIRSRVFRALDAIGARVETLVAAGATDDEAIAAVRLARAHALLVPFHAHRDHRGELVHGIHLIDRIRREVAIHASTPILCPVSNVGLAAAGLMSARSAEPILDGVLLLYEDELDSSGMLTLVRDFLVRARAS